MQGPNSPQKVNNQGCRNGRFGKRCSCPLPKTGGFGEIGKNSDIAFLHTKKGIWLRPRKSTKTVQSPFLHAQYDWTTGVPDNGKRMEEVPRRTSLVPLAFPCFVLCLIGVETEGLLDYQGRAGIMSIVRWNLRPVIFGVEVRPVVPGKGRLRPLDDLILVCSGRVHAKGVVLCERACFCLLSAFYNSPPSKNPSKNLCPY